MIPKELQEQIDEVLELNEKRTPGEWVYSVEDGTYPTIRAPDYTISQCVPHDSIAPGFEDSEFIAQAPQMAQLIRKLEKALNEMDKRCSAPDKKLHPTQQRILELWNYNGKLPTYRAMKELLGISSTSVIHFHVGQLRKKGLLKPQQQIESILKGEN